MVSRPRLRQPPGRPAALAGGGLPPHRRLTDKAIEFIKDAKAIAPEKPFFLYYAPGACHAPHHAPKEWIDKFKGRFDMGYEAMREQTLARQKEMGLVPADTELPPINPIGTPETRTGPDGQPFPALDYTRPWDSLNDDEKRLFARMAEVYAGFLGHADHHIGRLLDYLEQTEQLENTIVVVVSDNGASGEGGPNGSVNEMKFANGIPDDLDENLAKLDELGGTKTYNHYPNGWAMAFNTPFKMWKRYEFNGGTADPCIISWPAGTTARGEIRDQYHHAIDLVPTILDVLGVDAPETIKGHTQSPFDGVSMRDSLDDASASSARKTQFYSMLGSRSIWHDGWKAVTTHPTIAGWGHFNDDEWELYHTDVDRSELHDLAAEHPDKLRELVNIWFSEAGANGAFPLDDRSAVEILTTPRPQLTAPRNRYVYYPDAAAVSEWQAVNTRGRSFAIGALVDIPAPGAEGVLFAMGARFGGHALYVKDNRLHYVNSFVGSVEQMVVGSEDIPTGEDLILSAAFDKDGQEPDVRHRGPVALPRRPQGRRGPDQDPARRVRDRRRGPVRRPAPRRAGHRRLPRRASLPVHRRHDRPGRDRRQRRAVPRPRTRSRPDADARVSHPAGPFAPQPCQRPERRLGVDDEEARPSADMLASWNDTPARQAIVEFVERVSREGGPQYVPPAERIAVFDNDGTLWCEKPMPVELGFILKRLDEMADQDASLRDRQPWKAAREKDYGWLGGVITKHYHGDDTDVKVLMGGIVRRSPG